MPTGTENKQPVKEALARFASLPLADAARAFFDVLGYRSEKRLALIPNSTRTFLENFDQAGTFNREQALLEDWRSVDFLFQLTDDEIRTSTGGQSHLFASLGDWDGSAMESYLFFAIELSEHRYTRAALSGVTRAINRLFPMPVMIVFRHGDTLTVSVIDRRLNKRDGTKDVLEKVTLIKDIRIEEPHRAHIEILFDLSLGELLRKHRIANFVTLHRAWQETLDIQTLNRRFFIEVRNWFYWARLHARFPAGAQKDAEGRDSEALIRLLTRIIFCWFLREKRLIPDDIFAEPRVADLIADWLSDACDRDTEGRYYKAILQNLFFATLNTPVEERKFRSGGSFKGRNRHYGDQRFFRHVDLFQTTAPVEELYKSIPFLNGGLFEMLDEVPGKHDESIVSEKRVDGFSDAAAKQPVVPDFLFFGEERRIPELAGLLGEAAVPMARGLIQIFRDYKFTIEENTPLEQDIALDPELLGRAFENLLAAVNPETGTIARKSTGSFYTPREIVNYMVEEAVFRHLSTNLSGRPKPYRDLEDRLRELVAADKETHGFLDAEADAIVAVIGGMRILDPACGSGAFPMGLLQRLVHILHKLDPGNERWKATKLAALPHEMRQKAEAVFRDESFDYTRKLELIKDCIHGVDIQPAAIQISKLRFFLSLVIEQNEPRHVRPLPNLETKFVCGNSLLGLPRPAGWELFQHQIEPLERNLLDVRARYFFAQDKREKDSCRAEDLKRRKELSSFIEGIGGSGARQLASAVAAWDPYKPDRVAGYFDPESMFGIRDGFDITIGNPPYVRADEQSEWNQRQRQQILASGDYETLWEKWDLYVPFIERAYKLLKPGGISTLIVSDAFCHSKYAQKAQNWLLKNARILRLDFCGDLKIFDAAVHNLIYFFERNTGARNVPERRAHHTTFGNVVALASGEQENLTYRMFFPEDREIQAISVPTLPIGDICYLSYGLAVSSDEKLHKGEFVTEDVTQVSRDERHPKRWVEGKLLDKWLPTGNRWLEWGTARAPSRFRRLTFPELCEVSEKLLILRVAGNNLKSCYDDQQCYTNHTSIIVVPWHALAGVRNNSLKKVARYRGEKPPRPDLPKREVLEQTSRRFALKFLLAVMNSSFSQNFLRANRRSNTDLYPDDWKKLPIPDVPPSKQQAIVEIVDRVLSARRADHGADVSALEREVDAKINALFGITPSSPLPPDHLQTLIVQNPPYARTDATTKNLLRDRIVPALAARSPYFAIDAVRGALEAEDSNVEPATLNRYLHELTEAKFIYDAGRGWYSSIATPFSLNREPVAALVQDLRVEFPLLDFSCWSTEQIAGYGHHLLARFVAFVHTERDSMESVFDFLRGKGFDVYLNPRGAHAARFAIGERTVVVRPKVTTQPVDKNYVPIEGLLVDFFVESRGLHLIDADEYLQIFRNAIGQGRISMGRLVDYARQRQPATTDLLESINTGFSQNPALIDRG